MCASGYPVSAGEGSLLSQTLPGYGKLEVEYGIPAAPVDVVVACLTPIPQGQMTPHGG